MDKIQKNADKKLGKYGETLQILQNNEAIFLRFVRVRVVVRVIFSYICIL